MPLYTRILVGMIVGVLLGLAVGPNSPVLPADGLRLGGATVHAAPNGAAVPLADGLTDGRIVERREGWIRIEATLGARDLLRLKQAGVAGADRAHPGDGVTGWVDGEAPGVVVYARIGQALVDGTEWIGRLFLAMIKMVVVPLVFCSLAVGVASLGDFRKLGRLGGRTLVYFTCTTAVAVAIGVGLASLVRPGRLMSEADRASLLASYEGALSSTVSNAAKAPSVVDQLVAIVPTNPVAALASGDMLQVIFFALMLGIALTLVPAERAKPVVVVLDGLNEAIVMLVHVAMLIAPFGVAALLFKVVGTTGASVLAALSVYGALVVVGLLLQFLVVYAPVVRFGAGLPVTDFLLALRPALFVAFSTSSSNATLPVTKECVEENLGVRPEIASFVLPLGATVNMDGTALYQGVAAIFIAQIYGMDLSFGDQLTIVLSATLASVGAAGVPGAGLVTLAMVLTAVGVPTEGLALILGVDRLLDMFRTVVNVSGDATATVLMARLEGDRLRVLTPGADRTDPHRGFEGRLDEGPHAVVPDDER